MPEEVWSGFYGFNVSGDSTVVEDRFLYPIPNPPLFAGDRIISVTWQPIATKEQLFKELSSHARSPIWIKVERAPRGDQPKQIRIELTRGDEALLRRELGKSVEVWVPPVQSPQLTSTDVYSFGTIPPDMVAEIVGYCDDIKYKDKEPLPVLTEHPVAGRGTSRSEYAARAKLFKDFGDFILLDKRDPKYIASMNEAYFGVILGSQLRHDVCKKGEQLKLRQSMVLVEDPMKIIVDGKERKVSVLTLCYFNYDNDF